MGCDAMRCDATRRKRVGTGCDAGALGRGERVKAGQEDVLLEVDLVSDFNEIRLALLAQPAVGRAGRHCEWWTWRALVVAVSGDDDVRV